MRSRTFQGVTAALLMTSALWLAGSPAMAAPPDAAPARFAIRLLEPLWQWLGNFWQPDGLASRREAVQEESSDGPTSMTWTEPEPEPDRGGAIDPNGTR